MPNGMRRTVALTVAALALTSACTGARLPDSPDALGLDNGQSPAATASGAPGAGGGKAGPGIKGGAAGGGKGAAANGALGGAGGGRGSNGGAGAVRRGPGGARFFDANLFSGALNTRGITANQITLCAHAALTYAPAFHTGPSDFNVFWDALNDKGGIFGRKVVETYENDDYKPDTAVQAAKTCQQKNPFMILGGIGFDQIPAVRTWAEANHELYMYHSATTIGSAGDRYSFTGLPSVEEVGKQFAELAVSRFKGKRIGIIYRDSANWDPGRKAFLEYAKAHGLNVTVQRPVQASQGNYLQDVLALKGKTDVVWAWANAVETTEIIKQAQGQRFNPQWMVFPFNLTSQTLGASALNPPLVGVAMFPAYSYRDYTGGFHSYASLMKEFEAQYAKYDPGVDLSGLSGDLLFLNWVAQKSFADMMVLCGKNCTRNRFAGLMLSGLKMTAPPHCHLDFSEGDHHHGGHELFISQAYRSPSGKVNFRPVQSCVRP